MSPVLVIYRSVKPIIIIIIIFIFIIIITITSEIYSTRSLTEELYVLEYS